jgi:hypothetical protein
MPTYVEDPGSSVRFVQPSSASVHERDRPSPVTTVSTSSHVKIHLDRTLAPTTFLAAIAAIGFLLWRFRHELRLLDGGQDLIGIIVQEWQSLVLSVFLTWLVIYPVLSYLTYSWARKREEILNSLSEKDKEAYLALFQKDSGAGSAERASIRFEQIYDHWYGRRRYVLPILGLLSASFVDNVVLAHGMLSLKKVDDVLSVLAAASAGGYAYVTYDLILRQQRRDLSAPDVLRGALRLAIAIPVGVVFSSLAKDTAMFLAFAIGVFPLDTIALILRRLVNKKLQLEVGVDSGVDQVASLTGIDQPTADRIQQADITTITQLAWCDPFSYPCVRTSPSPMFLILLVKHLPGYILGKPCHRSCR